ncbi:class I adenylate-forming enzyme family protein [Parasphingorhabdus sp.]|uniref:class I adenylate-forming enzyme family protein n=1 Tax=Parasphingorhabdus sp. TaxID=2709688 RepID=UPI003A9286AF
MQTSSCEKITAMKQAGWWGNTTLDQIFSAALASHPDDLALIDPSNRGDLVHGDPRRLTFREIDLLADRLASRYFEAGLRQGDRIAVHLPNTVEIILVYLAAARLGLIVSPMAVQYGTFEVSHITQTIDPSAYIAFTDFRGAPFAEPILDILPDSCTPLLFTSDSDATGSKADVTQAYQDYRNGLAHSADDILTICWTSGTTGRPKGVPRSHNHWLSSSVMCGKPVELPTGAAMLCPFPFINMAAIGGFLFLWLQSKAKMILHHPFEPAAYLQQLKDEQCAYTIAPPAILSKLLLQKDMIKAAGFLESVKTIASGSAPLDPAMVQGFTETFGIDIFNLFGSNEGMALIGTPVDVPDTSDRATCFPRFGRPEFSWSTGIGDRIDTRLIDKDSGAEITEPGVPGELEIAGSTVFDGYYQSPEDNAEAFTPDGYFRSGDLFEITGDKNQYYRFVGRCKDLIIRGGMNISPEELDGILQSHPRILEAAVYGKPDSILGEKVCAVVVPMSGETITLKDLTDFMNEHGIAKFKRPEYLKIVDALPRSAMNKVPRHMLKDL